MSDRPFLAFGDYLRAKFDAKVYRVTVDAGFGCPNRDGTLGDGGCIYCRTESFAPGRGPSTEGRRGVSPRAAPAPEHGDGAMPSIATQMREGMARVHRRYGATKFLAYFQPFTNTYADPAVLKARYDEALVSDEVVGLCIGTRPDCVPDPVLDLIQEYARRLEGWLEYGLQSANDETLRRIHRGHDFATFADAVRRTQRRGIKVCAHVILGLPGETHDDMMRTADALASLRVDGVKMHHLHVVRGTALEEIYARGEVRLLTPEEYVPLAADFFERLPPGIVVHRLIGECRHDLLIAPVWSLTKGEITHMIEEELRARKARA